MILLSASHAYSKEVPMLPKSVVYVVVANSVSGSVACQPHVTGNVNLAIDHTLNLSDEMNTRAFDTFVGVTLNKELATSLADQWQNVWLSAQPNVHIDVTSHSPSTRRDFRDRDVWADDPDRMTRRGSSWH
jgi:hypothetical protein